MHRHTRGDATVIQTRRRIAPIATALIGLIGLLALLALPAVGEDEFMQLTDIDPKIFEIVRGSLYEGTWYGLDPASESWQLECEGRSEIFLGTLVINHTDDIDLMRCYRVVTGDLEFRSNGNLGTVSFTVLPWMELVNGDIKVVAGASLDEAWLPRLHTLGGKVSANYDSAFEGLYLQSMTELGDVYITTRTMDNTFTGFDSVTKVAHLNISNGHPEQVIPPGRGWNGLAEAGSLRIVGYPLARDTINGLLDAFTTVSGNVDLELNGSELYGVDNLTSVGGALWIHDSSIDTLDGLGSLQSVGGCVVIENTPNLIPSEINAFAAQIGKAVNDSNCS
jgi:hypothetical protein